MLGNPVFLFTLSHEETCPLAVRAVLRGRYVALTGFDAAEVDALLNRFYSKEAVRMISMPPLKRNVLRHRARLRSGARSVSRTKLSSKIYTHIA